MKSLLVIFLFAPGPLWAQVPVSQMYAPTLPSTDTSGAGVNSPMNNPAPGNPSAYPVPAFIPQYPPMQGAPVLDPFLMTPAISIPNAPVSTIPLGARYQVLPPMQGADLALVSRVRQALLDRDADIANRVQISASNGRVYLNGNLPTSADRDLVAGVARGSAGNLNIENELTVGQQ